MNSSLDREAQRQQLLLRALWRDDEDPPLPDWLRGGRNAQGIAAYRSNAGAIAERALQIAYPTVAALVGEVAFAALARDLWQLHPPHCGDLGEWGAALPELIAGNPTLALETYLPDSARVDWLVHRAARAADDPHTPPELDALGAEDAESLQLSLRSGCALVSSAWPVAGLWSAHQRDATEDRFSDVRALFAASVGEHAFVYRDDLAVRVVAIEPAAAAFTTAVLAGHNLAASLDGAGDDFDFPGWLVHALQARWLLGVHPSAPLQSTDAT